MTKQTRTTTEAELRALVAMGMSLQDISDRLATSKSRVSTTLNVLGIRQRASIDNVNAHDAFALLLRGLTMNQIAATLKCSPPTVMKSLKAAKLPTNLRAAVIYREKHAASKVHALEAVAA